MTSTVTRERPLKREIPRREKTTITKGVGYAQENDIHGNRQPKIFEVAISGAAKALLRLRDEGVVKAIGAGVNECAVAQRFLASLPTSTSVRKYAKYVTSDIGGTALPLK